MPRETTSQILKRRGLAPHKKLGQNFLVHAHTARRIVDLANLAAHDRVIEVGVGLGALTRPLATTVAEVVGIEMDSGIIRMHEEQQDLPANVRLLHADALRIDFTSLLHPGERLKIVANLPYSISTPFLFRLIDHASIMDSAVLMLQKEVALRLTAQPGTKDYGTPTVLLAACATVRFLLAVDPAEFHPRPKVDSVVVRLSFHPQPERIRVLGEFDRSLFSRVVHAAFGQRRKTLVNALHSAALLKSKEELLHCLHTAGIDPAIRAEKLTLEDFVHLSRVLCPHGSSSETLPQESLT
ncbi:16S rRNA (adenine(1518)-N(6)/adenine(1519)-N(6))-dimethyltransferase RsmA [Desulfobulbus alkaliphilus]|uniref:16S rRNA (adenine(1518)-N(6)/adenine(1519)-N(6))- dimethyltransferase RsmA n=1 Tax=Desulfobulbus alkaliphilus TaxID=869814 RepID=UPI001962CD04|nr:16S rRNA (adenine(1518)-N(6)/adenine(1519)-N(6))-dimethyltransferase RsmA [Desulfobulbus alkaliphilus]MBM9537611.1 ribosomal RNA small subunit methyltransferase A [Desulfobulbus alkaliphilus]